MANSPLPPHILLEDANDLLDFYEITERTVQCVKWSDEAFAAVMDEVNQSLF